MKSLSKYLLIVLIGMMPAGVYRASADLEVSASVNISATAEFHAPLTPHGVWVEFGSYGRCWRPSGVAVGWRPYVYGHWVWTDCGWYWASDEPWAWACYHYGSWVYDSGQGWMWVPGVEWAPAWVSWRVGGGYCGWAPLHPRGIVVEPGLFLFVKAGRFQDPIKPSVVVINNKTIIKNTTVISNVKRETRSFDGGTHQKVVINEGPGSGIVSQATGKSVKTVSIREAAERTPVPKAALRKSDDSAPAARKESVRDDPAPAKESREPKAGPKKDRTPPPVVAPPDKGNAPSGPGGKDPQERKSDPSEVTPPDKGDAPAGTGKAPPQRKQDGNRGKPSKPGKGSGKGDGHGKH
ncbi:MAG TPA: DUF6600 domain-containing protein [Roseimicrobium sp.]|nr:DUF6600 domain-containing protein [Roseimicrobium sp.]